MCVWVLFFLAQDLNPRAFFSTSEVLDLLEKFVGKTSCSDSNIAAIFELMTNIEPGLEIWPKAYMKIFNESSTDYN